MLKKNITYTDFNGVSQTETFYFNLSLDDVIDLDLIGMDGKPSRDLTVKDVRDIVLRSYGEKSDDGKKFVKSDDTMAEFKASAAYAALLMEFITDTKSQNEFIEGILPAELMTRVRSVLATDSPGATLAELPVEDATPAYIRENREPTQAELKEMTPEQLREAFQRKVRSS